jgi:hypothetical protein
MLTRWLHSPDSTGLGMGVLALNEICEIPHEGGEHAETTEELDGAAGEELGLRVCDMLKDFR